MLFSTYELVEAIRKDKLKQHPMFTTDNSPKDLSTTESKSTALSGAMLLPDEPRSAQV